jgi:hypothetical protein
MITVLDLDESTNTKLDSKYISTTNTSISDIPTNIIAGNHIYIISYEPITIDYSLRVYDLNMKLLCKTNLDSKDNAECITIWNIKNGKQYICIGTSLKTGVGGKLLVYKPSYWNDKFSLSLIRELKFSDSVTALNSFSPYLIACSGIKMYLVKIISETRQ